MNINLIINELLVERADMLARYSDLVGVEQWDDVAAQGLLMRFCEVLVDYAGMLHFELLTHLAEHEYDYPQLMRIAKNVYEPCVATTQAMLDFNECFGSISDQSQISSVEEQLSLLGEVLAERFEYEDALVIAMNESGYLESTNEVATST